MSTMPKELTKKELANYPDHGVLRVADLKKAIANLPDDTLVMVERVEDVYYEESGWGVYLRENSLGSRDNEGSLVKDLMDQYTPASSAFARREEPGLLFVRLHY